MKILQILGYERNQKYAGQWRLPLCSGEETYPDPGMTVEQYLARVQREDERKKSESYLKEQEIVKKFAQKKWTAKKRKLQKYQQQS